MRWWVVSMIIWLGVLGCGETCPDPPPCPPTVAMWDSAVVGWQNHYSRYEVVVCDTTVRLYTKVTMPRFISYWKDSVIVVVDTIPWYTLIINESYRIDNTLDAP